LSLNAIKQVLFTKDEIQNDIKNNLLSQWKIKSYNDFRENILDDNRPFPCYFAVEAEKRGHSRYIFSESAYNEDELLKVRDGIYEYIKTYRTISKRTTLVIFFKPSESALPSEAYKEQFWHVLNFLRENDPEPWVESIPEDPYNSKWEFCFGGEPIFVVSRMPIYNARKSRYTNGGLEITLQPRGTLDDITGDTKKGQQVRKVIRERLEAYDDVEIHPDIGDYGVEGAYEWKQYVLPERNEESVMRCPITGAKLND